MRWMQDMQPMNIMYKHGMMILIAWVFILEMPTIAPVMFVTQ